MEAMKVASPVCKKAIPGWFSGKCRLAFPALVLAVLAPICYNSSCRFISLKIQEQQMYLKKSIILLALILLTIWSAAPCLAAPMSAGDARTVNRVVETVKPALVMINVVTAECRQGRDIKQEAVGSGVIISRDGYVITNHHVAGHAKVITCTLSDKTNVRAALVGSDALSDIAVLKLRPDKPRTFHFAKFGDSDELRIGDRVLAMGSPLAFSQSVTMGIVSIKDLVIPEMFRGMEPALDGEEVGSVVLWIGHDAQIFPGNSGGPLVNMKGEIIGINEIKFGLSGAIPGNLAREVAKQLMSMGRVRRSWLGFQVQPMLKSAKRENGVFISDTIEGSPARRAGFQPGDILLSLGEKRCTVRFPEELPAFNNYVMSLPQGRPVKARVLRGAGETVLTVIPVDRETAKAKERELEQWGICASNITFFAARELKKKDSKGVVVTSVRPGSPAENAKPPLTVGDVIVAVGGKDMHQMDDFTTITRSLTAGKKDPVPTIVLFDREGDHYMTVVKLGISILKDPGLEVRKAWLPANVQVLTPEIAESLELGDATGVRITRLYPGHSAEKAGLKVGDFITALDSQPIPASQPEDVEVFSTMIRQYRIGTSADLTVIRDGKTMKIPVVLEESPRLPREMKRFQNTEFDFIVRTVTFFDCTQEGWPEDQKGAFVESVGEGGWASLGGLLRGDLIVNVDGKSVDKVSDLEAAMKEISASKPRITVLQVIRGSGRFFIELEPLWRSN
jgi:serine protease Do